MAGLLDFVAGFGVGALGGVAEQKKANLEQKRQLNLAKLKAEYASDIETTQEEKKIKTITDLMGRFREGDTAAADELRARGVDPSQSGDATEPDFQTLQNTLTGESFTGDVNDPEVQAKIKNREYTLVSKQAPSERFIPHTDADGTQTRIDTATGKEEIRIGRKWVPAESRERPAETGRGPELDVFLLEEDRPGRAEDLITGRTTATGTGPESLVRRGASRIPLLGEVLEQRTGGFAQEQAESSQFISRLNNQLRSEAARTLQPDGRLQTMVLELVKDVEIPKGILTTPTSTANQFRAVRKEVLREYELSQKRAINPNLSADDRMQARQYIERFKPLIDDMSLVILSHDAGKININYEGKIKKLNELSFDELKDAAQRYDNGTLDLDESQRFMMADLLKIHQYYNQ